MVTIGDDPLVLQRAHLTRAAAAYITGRKHPGEAVGIAVEPARPAGWTIAVRIDDVGVRGRIGPDPSDDEITAALAVLLDDARRQAELGAAVTARRLRNARP